MNCSRFGMAYKINNGCQCYEKGRHNGQYSQGRNGGIVIGQHSVYYIDNNRVLLEKISRVYARVFTCIQIQCLYMYIFKCDASYRKDTVLKNTFTDKLEKLNHLS